MFIWSTINRYVRKLACLTNPSSNNIIKITAVLASCFWGVILCLWGFSEAAVLW